MTVIVLIAAPEGLRGHLTRWMVEVSAGVFVGNPSQRVRDRLWTLLAQRIRDGQAIMVEPAHNEQRWAVRTAGTDRWHPVDYDGLVLSARPAAHRVSPTNDRAATATTTPPAPATD